MSISASRLLLVICFVLFAAKPAFAAKPIPEATPIDVPIPSGAQHLVMNAGDDDLRKVFTFFPYPPKPIDTWSRQLPLTRHGVYRIEVNAQGNVAAVTILKSMGKSMDYSVLKTLVRWKAKPGPLRVVDVNWTFWTSGRSFYR